MISLLKMIVLHRVHIPPTVIQRVLCELTDINHWVLLDSCHFGSIYNQNFGFIGQSVTRDVVFYGSELSRCYVVSWRQVFQDVIQVI